MGAGFARDLNMDSRQSRGMRCCGELDSMAEFHLVADHPGDDECLQVFEPYLRRPFGDHIQLYVLGCHWETVGFQVGPFE